VSEYQGITSREQAELRRHRPGVEVSILKTAYPAPKIGDPVRLDAGHASGDYEVAVEPIDEGETWRLSLVGLPSAAAKWAPLDPATALEHVAPYKTIHWPADHVREGK